MENPNSTPEGGGSDCNKYVSARSIDRKFGVEDIGVHASLDALADGMRAIVLCPHAQSFGFEDFGVRASLDALADGMRAIVLCPHAQSPKTTFGKLTEHVEKDGGSAVHAKTVRA